ncbi:MAG: glycosyl transferase, group 1 [Candidatus Saccharibacteria bacterium]|jgi:glycosyltransferase involved in cell wall biosynthesis|nr:glycosyl transferase, group 1 [Candidatus Saccharibacteria bacterium]
MHIVIDARIIHSSTGRYVERLLHYLQQIDTINSYTVLIPSKDTDYWKPSASNFSVKVADYKNYSFGEQIGFKKLLDSLNADLVHFCMPQQPILYNGATVTTFHDLTLFDTYNSDKNWFVFHAKQLIGRFVFTAAARKSRHIITPTEYVRSDVSKRLGVNKDKIITTYEAADITTEEPQPYRLPFKEFILYVGQQSDYKNIKRLGDAHQKLLATHPNLGLVLVGSKNASAIKNEAYFTENDYTNILFTGFVDDNQLAWLFKNCQVYAFPSLMEGFGLPGLEAMCYGAPVASSNATCLPEVYGDAAHYFNPIESTDIARAIEDILSDQVYREQLIANGYERAQHYSWKRMAEQTHAIYISSIKK